MDIKIIAAMDADRAIGKKNRLPWKLPSDLRHFKRTTLNKVIVMGYTTFESLPGVLPEREHWVLSKKERDLPEGVKLFHSIDDVLAEANKRELDELMVVGGAKVYEQFLPIANQLILTQIETEVEGADTYFPDWAGLGFSLKQCLTGVRQEADEHNFEFEFWQKK
tara:strand:- start:1397 stop:1891 length:495 start_codon:yes stop_codon:yes gene_type:complete